MKKTKIIPDQTEQEEDSADVSDEQAKKPDDDDPQSIKSTGRFRFILAILFILNHMYGKAEKGMF